MHGSWQRIDGHANVSNSNGRPLAQALRSEQPFSHRRKSSAIKVMAFLTGLPASGP